MLNDWGATFPNYLTTEFEEVDKYWDIFGHPAYILLDREGKEIAREPINDDDFTAEFQNMKDAALKHLKQKT